MTDEVQDNATELKVGDVVRLKGGGPVMTVVRVFEDKVECGWHVEDGQLHLWSIDPRAVRQEGEAAESSRSPSFCDECGAEIAWGLYCDACCPPSIRQAQEIICRQKQ